MPHFGGDPQRAAETQRAKGGGFGDLHARVRLMLPDPLTDEQRVLFERLRDATHAREAGAR
jgi:hypothetical protein